MFTYLANRVEFNNSHIPQRSTAAAGAINGNAVDTAVYEGALLVRVNAPVASSGDTITFTVEHSEASGSGFGAVPAAALVNADTGAAATFTVVTDAVEVYQTLALKKELLKRYVRVVATTAGTSIDVIFSSTIVGQKPVY